MPFLRIAQSRRIRRLAASIAVGLGALAAVACGSGDDGEGFKKIDAGTQVYSIDDFITVGFKNSKQYDVEGLSEATDAWMGFWGPGGSDRKDYELRFYPSHQQAADASAPLADEATGELFKERKDSQTWTEGQKDRWRSGNVTAGSTGGVTAGPGPIYADFAIFSNVVMLCEGAISEQSLERCESLVDALR